jgi:hypothetical protein
MAVELPLSTAYAVSSCSFAFKTSMSCKSSSVGSFLIFGNLTENQKKIAFNAIENLKNGDRLKAEEVSMLIANGKFSRANIDVTFIKIHNRLVNSVLIKY